MLDAFIIEEIKRKDREEERRRDDQRPYLEIPVPGLPDDQILPSGVGDDEGKPERGVMIIDFWGDADSA